MIPNMESFEDIEVENQPSLNYKMHFDEELIFSKWDKLEAMKQVVYKILLTERYQYIIYSWDYGIELEDLFGKPKTFVIPEIERRVREALKQDDRINEVDNFSFDLSKPREVLARFTVHTIFGDINAERLVEF